MAVLRVRAAGIRDHRQFAGRVRPAGGEGRVGFRDVDTMADILADWLTQNEFLAGDRFSACDVATGSQIGWGLQFRTIPARPALVAYWDRVKDRPAAVRAREADNAAAAAQKAAQHG